MSRIGVSISAIAAGIVLILLAAPFTTILTGTDWRHFSLGAEDIDAILTSISLGLVSLILIALLGTPVAAWLAAAPPGRHRAAQILVLLPLLTPPLALGILLATFYGGSGIAGRLGANLTNNRAAFILAAIYAGLPTYIIAARASLAEVPPALTEVARTLGLAPAAIFFRVALPLSRNGLAAALALAWVRAVGELGIVLIIAYFPQGMPIRLWVDLQDQGVGATFPLLLAFLGATLPLPLWLLGGAMRR
ncbi:MAG TPA: ABC transporter permease subunit [Acetobacteraceae bacterium]|nr:ABC transporter permease subunit [Acetobacteraceae bacterium]